MSNLKSIGAKIHKFFCCIPAAVWIHIVTLLLVFTISGVILAMFSNPEFAKQVFGLILILALIGFVLYLAFQLYMMIFDFICELIDNWCDR